PLHNHKTRLLPGRKHKHPGARVRQRSPLNRQAAIEADKEWRQAIGRGRRQARIAEKDEPCDSPRHAFVARSAVPAQQASPPTATARWRTPEDSKSGEFLALRDITTRVAGGTSAPIP